MHIELKGLNRSKKNNKSIKPEKGTCKAIKDYQNARSGLEYTTAEERVSQAPSAPSTKVLMEMNQHMSLHVNYTMTMK
jgi:hypothetical protein